MASPSAQARRAYVAAYIKQAVAIVDTLTNLSIGSVPLPPPPGFENSRTWGVAFTPDGHYAFVTYEPGSLGLINASTAKLEVNVPVGCGPRGIAVATVSEIR